MDPDRVRAYLQVACAGLGFDIGEIWWTSNDNGSSSALAAIEEKDDTGSALATTHKKLRFVQLYTSKSYENRRSMLVRPADEEENYNSQINKSEDSESDLEKHVLSPTLVDAISKTAQVVWAHTRKSEGLTGRSDIRLQTAVGMPVAVDREGNMCVVVMFSPNNIQSTDDAMEYLQSISRSATSSSIPSLLPAFDPRQGIISLPHHHPSNEVLPLLSNILSDGVTTRFVPLDEDIHENQPEVHSDHSLESAPRDCFGIPMLPAVAELEGTSKRSELNGDTVTDAFDEASYGVWSTIMNTLDQPNVFDDDSPSYGVDSGKLEAVDTSLMPSPTHLITKPCMALERQERLEEFASAFLDVSVFDLAEVWLPIGPQSDCLGLVTSVMSTQNNAALNEFTHESDKILIKFWSGAVGRAYSSGNPVWSFNKDVFSDAGRVDLFEKAKIETALAVPVFSGKSHVPAFVFCCYSFVRTGSVPFVLKFVQQALKLLWGGLDKVQPHESVGEDIWRDVAPADLGEMAADVEMQQHFMIKKRPIGSISNEPSIRNDTDYSLAMHIEALETPSGSHSVRSIYTGRGLSTDFGGEVATDLSPIQPIHYQTFDSVQNHIHDAIRSVADMQPAHLHIATNTAGSKRAHVFNEDTQQGYGNQQHLHDQPPSHSSKDFSIQRDSDGFLPPVSVPLPLPRPSPLPNHVINSHGSVSSSLNHQAKESFGSLQDLLQDSDNNSPTHHFNPVPDHVLENLEMHNLQQPYGNSTTYSVDHSAQQQSQTSPNPVYSVSFDQLSATGITFAVPPQSAIQQQQMGVVNGMAQNSPFCIPTSQPMQGSLTVNMNANGKCCRIQGCNEPAIARRPYCARHSGTRMCEHEGCNKCAQGSTRFCIAHGGGRRCTYPGCDKGARDKFFCAAHGGGKRCRYDGCNKSAVGGSSLCTAHGGGRRCSVDGCDKSAQSSTRFCVKHGGGKKCCHPGCDKVARGRTQYCAAHGGGVRCKLAGCNRVAIGKLQLCRAHGGGARSKNSPSSSQAEATTTMTTPMMGQFQQQSMANTNFPTGTIFGQSSAAPASNAMTNI